MSGKLIYLPNVKKSKSRMKARELIAKLNKIDPENTVTMVMTFYNFDKNIIELGISDVEILVDLKNEVWLASDAAKDYLDDNMDWQNSYIK